MDTEGKRPARRRIELHVVMLNDGYTPLGNGVPPEDAVHLLSILAFPAEAFAWHMVDKGIGNVRNQDPRLAEPLLLS